ncbi:MAG: phage tail protein [Desulfovibrio sp. S3730MH75]|nr:MAG: phage tail protein [Desulfovibrio sp. S3730MH75]
MRYVAIDGDMLDDLCFKQYGRENAVTAILEANPGLAGKGPILTAGTVVVFPDLEETAEENTTVKLWD